MEQRLFQILVFSYALILTGLTLPGIILAHGTGYRVQTQGKAVIIECYYSDGTAMAYAESYIFSPQNSELEHQNGRTDKNGRVAFFPDTQGIWKITVNDGQGHKIQGQVVINPGDEPIKENFQNTDDSKRASIFFSAALGISLIFNLCCFFAIVFRKRH